MNDPLHIGIVITSVLLIMAVVDYAYEWWDKRK